MRAARAARTAAVPGTGAAAILMLFLATGPALAKSIRVTISVPVPARIDMEGIRRVLVTRFVVGEEPADVDLNKEVVSLLRREIRKGTRLEILGDEPPPLPEQPFETLLANTGFWRRLAAPHGADLLISGKAGFRVADRSGFVQVDEISPVTGQRLRRTRFVDREGFELDLHLFFIRGSTGQLLYEDHFTGENVLNGKGNDRLTSMFAVFEQFQDSVLGILVPTVRTAQRNLFTE